jgi:hypothetical protein
MVTKIHESLAMTSNVFWSVLNVSVFSRVRIISLYYVFEIHFDSRLFIPSFLSVGFVLAVRIAGVYS